MERRWAGRRSELRQGRVRRRRRIYQRHASRGRPLPLRPADPPVRGDPPLRKGGDRNRSRRRLLVGAALRRPIGSCGSCLPCRARGRSGDDGSVRPARRQSRRVLPENTRCNPSARLERRCMLGFSSYTWRVKHNVAHHTYTNVDGYDDDVSQVPLARFAPSQQPRRPEYPVPALLHLAPLHARRHVRWQTMGDILSLVRGRFARPTLPPAEGLGASLPWCPGRRRFSAGRSSCRSSSIPGGPCSPVTSASR